MSHPVPKQLRSEQAGYARITDANKSLVLANQILEIVPYHKFQALGILLIALQLHATYESEETSQLIQLEVIKKYKEIEDQGATHLSVAISHLKEALQIVRNQSEKKKLKNKIEALESIHNRIQSGSGIGIGEKERRALRVFAAAILGGGYSDKKAQSLAKAREARARNRPPKQNPSAIVKPPEDTISP